MRIKGYPSPRFSLKFCRRGTACHRARLTMGTLHPAVPLKVLFWAVAVLVHVGPQNLKLAVVMP
jgi:hypothetical protein